MSFETENFESKRSLVQDLTFTSVKTAFERYSIEFSPKKYLTLGMVNNNDLFTNLALLMSDQCQHTIKVAVFTDETCTVFRDSKEFGGSVFKQFEDTVDYLALCNRTRSEIKGVIRTDWKDYPEEAIREALLNALVHRDYSYSGSIIINVNDEKMEFISIGGLLPGLSADDICLGISQPRNKNLAEVFHRLRLIESHGTGIRHMEDIHREEIPAFVFRLVDFISEVKEWQGTATELIAQMNEIEVTPNVVTKMLARFSSEVFQPQGIEYKTKRTGTSRLIRLKKYDSNDGDDNEFAI